DAASVTAISSHLSAMGDGDAAIPRGSRDLVHLLVQVDGAAAEIDGDELRRVINDHGGSATVTTDPAEAERLLTVRRAFHASLERLGTVLIEDVCVPRSALADMFREIARVEQKFGLTIPTVAHAGDGNLHPNFIVDTSGGMSDIPDTVWEAASELFRAALRVGGTLTGEHGVGLLKRRWLGEELGSDNLHLQQSLKSLFDPQGILNPDKVF
ncbi:MAG TPA: FAD-linked oxidase C-terminal domain-containing protein, partial [Terrimesophilobacter sp.]|nr:FAD-linked oxidase C-terminal domain-containing protein [Terrimesophilobacter sp.]